ncbi:MAG: hypothetical protein SFU25_12120 [Candidatus Caenarcaniphilales bacterium]|nr:hypothetical protein [Candidatus Caenarcaniphilales bacterium]
MGLIISLKNLYGSLWKAQEPGSVLEENARHNEKKSLKEWPAANILISINLITVLLLASYAGYWGLVSNELKDVLKIFPQSLLIFLFAFLLPINWLLFVWLCFIGAAIQLNLITYTEPSFVYYFTLPLSLIILRNTKWYFWFLIPFITHAFALLYIFVFYKYFSPEQFNVLNFLNVASFLSKDSFTAELIAVYPLTFLSQQLNKFINIFRYLE